MDNLITEGMHAVTHTWSSSDGKSWKHRGEHDSSDDATDAAMTRVGKESGYHAIGTKEKALYYVDHKGRTHGINEAVIEVPHDRKFSGKKKTAVDVKPTLKSSAEQYGNKSMNVRESSRPLDTPKKMKYIGPSDSVLTQGQTVHALSHKMISGGVRVDTGKHRVVVHHRDLVDEEAQIDELSYKTLTSYAAKARSNIAHRKYLKYGEPDKSAEHDNKIAKHEEGIKVAKEKTKPPVFGKANVKVKHSEAEAADRKIADISAKLSKTVRPSSNTIKATLGKMSASAQKIADLRNKKAKMSEENQINKYTIEEFLDFIGSLTEQQALEEIEMLDELSRKTLTSYTDKASDDMIKLSKEAKTKLRLKNFSNDQRGRAERSALGKKYDRKIIKRFDNYSLAHEKLNGSARVNASEEVEPIDELSKKTLGSYARKAENEKFDYDPESHKARKRDESIRLALAKIEMKKGAERGQKISDRLKKVAPKRDGYQNWPGQKKRPFRSYSEEVEPIDELSRDTLGSYIDAAKTDYLTRSFSGKYKGNYQQKLDKFRKLDNRERGLNTAKKKMGSNLFGSRAKISASEETVSETNRPSHHNPTVLVTYKGNKGAGGVKRIPKSEYDPKIHSLVEWVSKEQLAANRKARVDKFIENGVKVKKIMDDEHKKNGVKKYAKEKVSDGVKEENQFITDLQRAIETNGVHPVTFADGSRAAISPGYANYIIDKYSAISEESKRDEFVSTISSNLKTLRESIKR